MKSMFDPIVYSEIIERIEKLTPDKKPLWGKMNPSQMIKHSQVTFQMVLGEMSLKRSIAGLLFGKMAKKSIMKDEPFRKNIPTAKEFIIKDQPDFEKEKNTLLNLIKEVEGKGPDNINPKPHTFFGTLSVNEWDHLMYKHMDHHLRQFGV